MASQVNGGPVLLKRNSWSILYLDLDSDCTIYNCRKCIDRSKQPQQKHLTYKSFIRIWSIKYYNSIEIPNLLEFLLAIIFDISNIEVMFIFYHCICHRREQSTSCSSHRLLQSSVNIQGNCDFVAEKNNFHTKFVTNFIVFSIV